MFEVNQRVKIKGDYSDFTEHLDNRIGTIVQVNEKDCWVVMDFDFYTNPSGYLIWNRNIIHE